MTRQYDPRMEEFAESDAFLDALSRGDDVSGGTDPLAAALLGLKADIDRPMPPAPVLDAGADTTVRRDGGNGEVASLDAARAKRRTANPWVAGLIGAAAATVACMGTGAVLYGNAQSHRDTTMVELATTLDELEVASQSGDEESTRNLLEQARGLVASLKERPSRILGGQEDKQPKTVTSTLTVTEVPETSHVKSDVTERERTSEAGASSAAASPATPAAPASAATGDAQPSAQPSSAAGTKTAGTGAGSGTASGSESARRTSPAVSSPSQPAQPQPEREPAQPQPERGDDTVRTEEAAVEAPVVVSGGQLGNDAQVVHSPRAVPPAGSSIN